MSSGTYFPPPVRAVEIPKPHGGGVRMLGVPTVADRVAQTVVVMYLESLVEPRRAVQAVTDCPWVLLYVKRWLAAPLQHPGGAVIERTKGTPQGSAVSPVLANLFMHYAFDTWMARNFPGCPSERYADDAIVRCKTRAQAEHVLSRIAGRMEEVGLRLHPDKTRIVYCKDSNRRGKHEHVSFTFLGFAFRPREAINRETGERFTSFSPAISPEGAQGQGRPAPRDADSPAH